MSLGSFLFGMGLGVASGFILGVRTITPFVRSFNDRELETIRKKGSVIRSKSGAFAVKTNGKNKAHINDDAQAWKMEKEQELQEDASQSHLV